MCLTNRIWMDALKVKMFESVNSYSTFCNFPFSAQCEQIISYLMVIKILNSNLAFKEAGIV